MSERSIYSGFSLQERGNWSSVRIAASTAGISVRSKDADMFEGHSVPEGYMVVHLKVDSWQQLVDYAKSLELIRASN